MTEKDEKARAIILDYLKVREMSFGENHRKNKSTGMLAFAKIRTQLRDADVSYKILDHAAFSRNPDEALDALCAKHPEVVAVKKLCATYIEMKRSSLRTDLAKEKAKRKILAKLASIDPMLAKFVEYKVKLDHARRTLGESLVSETPESLEARYKDTLEGLFQC